MPAAGRRENSRLPRKLELGLIRKVRVEVGIIFLERCVGVLHPALAADRPWQIFGADQLDADAVAVPAPVKCNILMVA